MLYDDPVDFISGLQIYRDFSNDKVFYYLPPEAPRVAKIAGGDALALRLVLYRPDPNASLPAGMEEGGGFLNLDVDLDVPESVLEKVEEELRSKHGDVELVPVPFTDGSVELVLLGVSRADDNQPFVRKVAGSAVPSLYGSQRAAFSVVLDRHGAALMRQVLAEGGVTMALAIYHLKYAAIGPAYNLKITIDYSRVHETMDLRLNAGVSAGSRNASFVAKAGFHMLMEELKENRAIVVEEVDPVPGEDGHGLSNQEAIDDIIANLMGSTWFRPSLSAPSQLTQLQSGASAATPSTPAATPSTPAATPSTPAATPSTPAATPSTPAATPSTPAATRQPAGWHRDRTEPTPGFPSTLGVEPLRASESGTSETLVFRGEPTAVTANGTSVPITTRDGKKIAVIEVPSGAVEHTVTVVVTWAGSPAPRLHGRLVRPAARAAAAAGDATPTEGTPATPAAGQPANDDPTKVQASFEINFEMIERQEKITATYDLSSRKARLHEIHPQGQLVLDVPDPEPYIIEADGAIDFFQSLDLAASTTATWELDGIDSIQIQVRYGPRGDGDFIRRGEMMLSANAPTDTWKVNVLHLDDDPSLPVVYWYEYRVTVHFRQGVALGDQQGAIDSVGAPGADAEGWIRSYARNLVIHPRDVTPAITVDLMTGVLRYDLLEKAQVVLSYGPYRQNLLMSAETPQHRLVIRPEQELEAQVLRTEGVLYYKDGAQVPLPPTEWTPHELIVINEARENILRVRVILADPNHEFQRVQVRLRYEHGNRVEEQSIELTEHAQLEEWAVRLEDPQQRAWTYEATMIKKSGAIETTDWQSSDDDLLILGVQAADVIPVQVTWLIPPPAGGLLAVQIELAYDDERLDVHWRHSAVLQANDPNTFTWSIAIKDRQHRSYRYRVVEYYATGPREGQWHESDSKALVLLPGA